MVAPLIIWGAVALAGLAAAGTAYVCRHDIATILWGRPMAVLGQRGVGKTVLFTFLTTGSVVTDYTPSRGSSPVGRGNYATKNANADNLYVARSVDVSGDDASTAAWRDAFERAAADERGICLYLIDASKILAEDEKHIERIRMDMDRISDWSAKAPFHSSPRIAVIATHIDLVGAWARGTATRRTSIEDSLRRHEVFSPVLADSGRFLDVLCADLSNKDGFVRMLDDLCGALTAKGAA